MKKTTNNENLENTTVNESISSNPFDLAATEPKTESRSLDFTPALVDCANRRAHDLMLLVGKRPELHELANRMMDEANASDLIELIEAVYSEDDIATDAALLEGCDEDQLGRMLESRRSDRSKAKRKGPRASVQVCKAYIAAMYAELLIRVALGKPYTGMTGSNQIDVEALANDADAVARKVKSLQSKKCRLKKLAAFDKEASEELARTEEEIDRLNALRPSSGRVAAKVAIKSDEIDKLREVLKSIDPATLPEGEQEKFLELMSKIG